MSVRHPRIAARIDCEQRSFAIALLSLPLVVCCRSAPSTCPTPTATRPASFVCDRAHDYRAFEASATLRSLDSFVPRKAQTPEFKRIGRRAWFFYSVEGPYRVLRAVFTTSDGRYDLELVVEIMDSTPETRDSFQLLPEALSDEYDKHGT